MKGTLVPQSICHLLWHSISFQYWPSRDEENFCATVPKDGRSYSPTLFAQTVRVLKKINKPGNMIVAFSNLAERIKVRRIVCLLTCSIKITLFPWLMWLSGLSANLWTERSLVNSQSGHMPGLWARSLVGACERQPMMFLSLSFSLPPPLSKNKL